MRVAPPAIYLILLLVISGKLAFLPVALVGPAGSDSPAFMGLARYVPLASGDKVLYCVDLLRTACVLSRGGRVVYGTPCYTVLVEIPGWLWALAVVSATLTPLSAAVMAKRFGVVSGVIAALLALNLAAVGSLYVSQEGPQVALKGVELRRAGLNPVDGAYEVELELGAYEILGATCALEGYGTTKTWVDGNVLKVGIPREYFEWLYRIKSAERVYLPPPPASVYQAFKVYCSTNLDKGRLEATYVATIIWKEPLVLAEGSRVAVVNWNPVGIKVKLEAVSRHAGVSWIHEAEVEPLGELSVDLSGLLPSDRYEVRVRYEFVGVLRAVKVDVAVEGVGSYATRR